MNYVVRKIERNELFRKLLHIPLLMFPKPINYATITILTLGDGVASLAGRLVG